VKQHGARRGVPVRMKEGDKSGASRRLGMGVGRAGALRFVYQNPHDLCPQLSFFSSSRADLYWWAVICLPMGRARPVKSTTALYSTWLSQKEKIK
jgi:hypothetical protein